MTTWPIVGDGKSIRPSHITTLQDAIDGIHDGTVDIPLAGIADALAQWAGSSGFTGTLFKWKPGMYINMNSVYPASDFSQTEVLTANTIYATPLFVPPGGGAIDRVTVAVQTGAGTNSRLMYFAPGTDGHPGALLFDFGTVNTSSSGDKQFTVSATLPGGPGWLAMVPDGAITVYMFSVNGLGYIGGPTYTSGTAGSPYRANDGTTAPNPFGTTSISYLGYCVRLGVRAA